MVKLEYNNYGEKIKRREVRPLLKKKKYKINETN